MNIPYVFKKCSKCGRWLVANKVNFSKYYRGKYRLSSRCKQCDKQYRQEHKEGILQYQQQYRQNNKEQLLEKHRQYHKEHKEQRNEYSRQYNKEHKEEQRQRDKQYYYNNREKILERSKQYYQTPQGQTVRFNNLNKYRTKLENNGGQLTVEQWTACMEFFDWKCGYSGKSLTNDNKSIDHIIPVSMGGSGNPWNCVPMDKSLNSSKRDTDMMEWYTAQDFYSKERLDKILAWQEYAYNKWSVK